MKNHLALLLGSVLAGCASGGVGVLPESTNTSNLPWSTYQDAHAAYHNIVVNSTTHEGIQALGFNPDKVPNIKVLNYVDVVNLFGPAFRMEDMPPGIRTCVNAKEKCFAYAVKAQNIQNKRDGNIAADLLGFQKKVTSQGWEFTATLVMVDGKVVYKLWNGTPDIHARSTESNPLGPMQNMSGLIPKPF